MIQLVLSRNAHRDLKDIQTFTEGRWSAAQWQTYFSDTQAAFERITKRPNIGRPRPEFRTDMRSVNVGAHVVFYRPIEREGVVRVLRIVRQSRDLTAIPFR